MLTGQITNAIDLAGISANGVTIRTADGQISHEVALPAGKSGTLSTRTDDDTGVATLAANHGITVDDYVDVYWDGGVRYGMDVTGVEGTAVSIDLGDGDNLPTQDTVIIVTPRVEIDVDFDGDNVEMIAAVCPRRAHLEFLTDADVSIKVQELTAAEPWSWVADQGVTNPLTGDPVGKIQASCGEATAATLKIGVLYDSTP